MGNTLRRLASTLAPPNFSANRFNQSNRPNRNPVDCTCTRTQSRRALVQGREQSYMKKLAILFGVILLFLGGLYWVSQERAKTADQQVVLGDGTRVGLIAITVGTNHIPGLRMGQWVNRLPPFIGERIQSLLGVPEGARRLKTSTTNLVVWMEHSGLPGGPFVSRTVMLRKPGGRHSGVDQYAQFSLANGRSNKVHSVSFANWPRREPWLECVILERDQNYNNIELGSFRFPNPWVVTTPSWNPDPIPTTKQAGDLNVTLQNFVTGIGNKQTGYNRPDGTKETIYEPAPPNEDPRALVSVQFESPRGTNETWKLFNANLSDALGNHVGAGTRSDMTDSMKFGPVLWPEEKAWKVRLHLKRSHGFEPQELLTFSNVPLPELGATLAPNLTNVVMGVESRLTEFRRQPSLDKNRRSWSGRDLSGFRLDHDDLGITNQIDLVSITLQPSGQTIRSQGSSWSNDYHEYDFKEIPEDATHVDLVFSVQKARFVEFLVAPNWVTNNYVIRE